MPSNTLKLPWHYVPGYRGAEGYEKGPHIVNCDGELVAVFEDAHDGMYAEGMCNMLLPSEPITDDGLETPAFLRRQAE